MIAGALTVNTACAPFRPQAKAARAPAEGTPEAPAFLAKLKQLF